MNLDIPDLNVHGFVQFFNTVETSVDDMVSVKADTTNQNCKTCRHAVKTDTKRTNESFYLKADHVP